MNVIPTLTSDADGLRAPVSDLSRLGSLLLLEAGFPGRIDESSMIGLRSSTHDRMLNASRPWLSNGCETPVAFEKVWSPTQQNR